FPGIDVRPEGELLCVNDPDYTGFDYQIPVGSLGRVFRRSIDDFHDKQKPWIARNSNAEARIREQLAIQPRELLVGVCWQSMNQAASRSRNFVNYRHLETLNSLNGVRWLNLQYNSTQDDIDKIRECGLDMHHYVDLDQKNDLVGACNLIGACELVIWVGVSVADLTGGVGTPMIYIGPVMSELYLGTGQVPWFVNSKFYPIATNKGDDTLARIVHDWPEISQWAECFKSEERKARDRSGGGAVPLDLEYPFAGEMVS
ncbi:MAG: hypothetical protein HKN11_10370, partial [Rhizobiales bacterium]|nr:hypothetical protein [Hyphomicrobiales bacterium]